MVDLTGSSAEEDLFKCSCDGENPNCMHCDGTGLTRRAVAVRTGGVRIPNNPTTDPNTKNDQSPSPLETGKEKRFARQVQNELPRLRSKFLEQGGDSSQVYILYLTRLVDALFPSGSIIRMMSRHTFKCGDLRIIAKDTQHLDDVGIEELRILGRAVKACLLEYEHALKKKSALPRSKRVAAVSSQKSKGATRCGQCGLVVFDLKFHNRSSHPTLNRKPARKQAQKSVALVPSPSPVGRSHQAGSPPEPVAPPHSAIEKKTAEVVQGPRPPATIIRPTYKKLECPDCGAMVSSNRLDSHIQRLHRPPAVSAAGAKGSKQAKAPGPKQPDAMAVALKEMMATRKSPSEKSRSKKRKALPIKSGQKRPPPSSGFDTEFSRDRADTGRVERAMDARRTWGGRFRDTNGTFGSHPLHDNMDDESDAG